MNEPSGTIEQALDRPVRLLARITGAPSAFVALVDGDRLRVVNAVGLAPSIRELPLFPSAGDVDAEALLSTLIAASDGRMLGIVGVVDRKARTWAPDDAELGEQLAAWVAAQLELRELRASLARIDRAPYDLETIRQTEEALRQKTAFLEEQTATVNLLKAIAFAANQATTRTEVLQGCLDRVCAHMGWPVGHAYLVSYDRLVTVTVMAPERGLVGGVFRTGEASWTADVATDLEYLRAGAAKRAGLHGGFAFPVLAGAKVVAVLEFYTEVPQPPNERLLDVMVNVGTQIGRVFEREMARAKLEVHAEQVRARSLVDELTGLYNRRGFYDAGRERLRSAIRDGQGVAAFFVDLNGMKPINDQFGHEHGDRALIDMADVLRTVFRESDIVARLGGDEFAVFTDQGSPEDLRVLGVRLQSATDAINASGGRPYVLSASVGIATYDPKVHRTFEALVACADALMYVQKGKHQSTNAPAADHAPSSRRIRTAGR